LPEKGVSKGDIKGRLLYKGIAKWRAYLKELPSESLRSILMIETNGSILI
jgi:hypothetical protein